MKPAIIAQLYYPSSNGSAQSTDCKIHPRNLFQSGRFDQHDSNTKCASIDWPIEATESLTDAYLEKVLRSHERNAGGLSAQKHPYLYQ